MLLSSFLVNSKRGEMHPQSKIVPFDIELSQLTIMEKGGLLESFFPVWLYSSFEKRMSIVKFN